MAFGAEPVSLVAGDLVEQSSDPSDESHQEAKPLDKTHDVSVSEGTACHVAVVGNGNFGRALARKLSASGVPVVIGRRNSSEKTGADTWGTVCDMVSHSEAVRLGDIIFLAIPHHAYDGFLSENAAILRGKVVVDVANPVTPGFFSCVRSISGRSCGGGLEGVTGSESSAQRIQALLSRLGAQDTFVVKAFNTLSAHELDNGFARLPPQVVTVSSDNEAAKRDVMNLARKMRYSALDFGGLENAIIQERTVHRFFNGWVNASIIGFAVLVLLTVFWANIYYYGEEPIGSFWIAWLLNPVGDASVVLLCFTFLPGIIAGLWQLVRADAKRPFPAWFASWLNIRKQFGLLAFFYASLHGIAGCLHGLPTEEEEPGYGAYTYLSYGVIAYVFFAVLAACSGTVGANGQMSWMEFKFVFGALGYATMALVLVHIGYLLPEWIDFLSSPDADEFGYKIKAPLIYLSMALASLTMFLKIAISVPPVSWWLSKVRAK